MKKFLAKITLFSITSLILISTSSVVTHAGSPEETLRNGLDDLTYVLYCIHEVNDDAEKTPGPDSGYIITIVEEPLTLEETPVAKRITDTNKPEFEERICYRNSLSYTLPKKKEVIESKLAQICSKHILSGEFDKDEYKEYRVTSSCKPVQVYLSKGGTALITNYIATIYKWAASMVGIIAVTVVIISAIQISLAGGDTQAIENAKSRIIKSLSGIVVLFLSGLILYTINPTFFTK